MIRTLAAAVLTLAMAAGQGAQAQTASANAAACQGSNMLGTGLLANVCWSCIFPIRVSGVTLFGSPQSAGGTNGAGFTLSSRPGVPSDAVNDVACACLEGSTPHVGLPIGMWQPTTIYEHTYLPGCSPTLSGTTIGVSDPLYLGTEGDPNYDLSMQSFHHVHTLSYPAILLLELFTSCNHSLFNDIDLLYISELDPLWNDAVTAQFSNPMSIFGSSLPAQAACMADAVSSSLGKPLDELFWCGGTWTSSLSPYTGFEHNMGPLQLSSAGALKLLAMNHLRGFSASTVGGSAMCEARYDPLMERSEYRWQVAWPRQEGRRNHASGESLQRWGYGRLLPGIGELPIFLQWQWVDCCTPLLGQ